MVLMVEYINRSKINQSTLKNRGQITATAANLAAVKKIGRGNGLTAGQFNPLFPFHKNLSG